MTDAYPDMVFSDREILPMSTAKLGVIITDKEAHDLIYDGYPVKTTPRVKDEDGKYYLEVYIPPKLQGSSEIAMLETAGRGDVVISPVPWRTGRVTGTKAYLKSVEVKQAARAIDRYDIAWRIWMWHSGFTEDAEVFAVDNWMRKDDDDLRAEDIEMRDILLKIADTAIDIGRKESKS